MSEKALRAASILIVDDDKDFLEIFSTKLKSAGFRVTTAMGGQEGIDTAKANKPDLMLLDVEMPNMNGVETLFKIRHDPDLSALKVVFITNYGEPQKETSWIDEKFAREAGATDYIKKTEDLEAIVNEVNKVLRRYEVFNEEETRLSQ